jgi:Mlc titration factor MtfA (ptsG expression regulator)
MNDPVVIALALAAALVFAGIIATARGSRRQTARREELLARGLTTRERVIVEKAWPWFRRLPGDLRPRLEGVMRVLMEEKIFEACGGLPEVTREMRLVITAQAGLLVVNRPPPWYPELVSILVYPGAFTAPVREYLDDAVEIVDVEERLGESSAAGTVVLAWDAVLRGGSNHEDGLNLVMHEFAHQLDQLNGDADGAPILDHARDYESWSRVFHAAYGRHVEESERDEAAVLDEYGAEDAAEFFAVATETFFERPRELHDEYPELFHELAKFYRLDPREWK